MCNLVHHGHMLPPPFQNFDSIPHVTKADVGHYGGSVALADYCPYIQEFTWRSNNVVVRGSHCAFPENQPSEWRLITCFIKTLRRQQIGAQRVSDDSRNAKKRANSLRREK